MRLVINDYPTLSIWRSASSATTLIDQDDHNAVVGEFPSIAVAAYAKKILEWASRAIPDVPPAALHAELRRVCWRDHGTDDYTSIELGKTRPLIDAVFLEFRKDKASRRDSSLVSFGAARRGLDFSLRDGNAYR